MACAAALAFPAVASAQTVVWTTQLKVFADGTRRGCWNTGGKEWVTTTLYGVEELSHDSSSSVLTFKLDSDPEDFFADLTLHVDSESFRIEDGKTEGFGGGAIAADGRAALLFSEGESSVARALLHRNGYRSGDGQVRGGIVSGVQFEDRDPKLRNILWEANPDPRPKPGSPALPKTKSADRTPEDDARLGAVSSIPQPTPFRLTRLEAHWQTAVTEACRPGVERLGYPVDAPRPIPAISGKPVAP